MTTEERTDLYEFEKNRFLELLDDDESYAYKRYGLTLLYSLEPEETYELRKKMGWQEDDGLDHYNLGTMEAQQENLQEAMKHFRKAESLGCDQPELFFNIALILEQEDKIPEAIEYYQKYVDACEHWDEIPKRLQNELDEARDHIKDLKGEKNQEDDE